jgi:hypothetical protein
MRELQSIVIFSVAEPNQLDAASSPVSKGKKNVDSWLLKGKIQHFLHFDGSPALARKIMRLQLRLWLRHTGNTASSTILRDHFRETVSHIFAIHTVHIAYRYMFDTIRRRPDASPFSFIYFTFLTYCWKCVNLVNRFWFFRTSRRKLFCRLYKG